MHNFLRVLAWASHCEDARRTIGTPGYRVKVICGSLLDNFLGVVVAKFATTTADGELEQESNLHILQKCSSGRPTTLYSLDVIISVGYRVKSQRGVEFRRWATNGTSPFGVSP